jgi:DNA-binding CsgD family transcriptional regulator
MSNGKTKALMICGAIGAFLLIMTLEIVTESDPIELVDVAVDGAVLFLTILSAASVGALFAEARRAREERDLLVAELDTARRDGARWRAAVDHHVHGLRSAIDHQFDMWSMTLAEREVGLMMLKGFSHKEIGALRRTSEGTVRQQAQAIYRKSNLPGKNAFNAFFLEDLLTSPPHANGESSARPTSGEVRHRSNGGRLSP